MAARSKGFLKKILNNNVHFNSCRLNIFTQCVVGLNVKHRCCSSEAPNYEMEEDVESLFLDTRVQKILKSITGFNLKIIFRPVSHKITTPKYQFLTDEQLQEMMDDIKRVARNKLQMPPFLKRRKPIQEVLSKDPELQELMSHKLVFVDLTPGLSERERHVVVREPNGILRRASWEEKERLGQTYFPVPGRQVKMPRMFLDEHLRIILDQHRYEYVLDRACVQFQPDDPVYIRVTRKTFDHVDANRKHDLLRSTRHFGPIAFHLVLQRNVDNLLLDMIQRELLEDSVDLVRLYHLVHPECSSAQSSSGQDDVSLLTGFVERDAIKRSSLELALQTYRELQKQKTLVDEGIKKAHGHL